MIHFADAKNVNESTQVKSHAMWDPGHDMVRE